MVEGRASIARVAIAGLSDGQNGKLCDAGFRRNGTSATRPLGKFGSRWFSFHLVDGFSTRRSRPVSQSMYYIGGRC